MQQPQQQQMVGWFQAVDTDRSGKLNYKELQRAFQQAGLNYSLTTCNMFLRLFDPNQTQMIDCNGFINLFAWIHRMDGAFFHFDQDRSGTLEHAEVYNAVKHAFPNMPLDSHAFHAAIKTYDVDGNGRLARVEFIALAAYLELCQRTFQSFDTQRTGNVNMHLSQFVFAASQCK
eukprot:TRINITY_DN6367_c0_g1_i1.p1 TRINITY_DN6367_c0_g1~~TRINITY_DN6367_c0_g1_i1.p1  ORF type:complete len:174 (+),score=90.24 TRINITY_DN6367_c0_g1_i1:60-581(+)